MKMASKVTIQANEMPVNDFMKLVERIAPRQNATIQAQFNPQVILEQMFIRYKSRLLELSSKIRKLVKFDSKHYENNDKYLSLFLKPEAKEVQLGDKVKINMKKRQFKQFRVGSWNESIMQDFNSVGTVISLWEDGEREAVVHYYRSGKSWAISRRCLVVCNDDACDEQILSTNSNGLKLGDSVTVLHEDNLIRTLQAGRKGNADQIIAFRPYLNKILAFDNRDNAFVSCDDHQSLLINSALLSLRPAEQNPDILVTIDMEDAMDYFPLKSYVVMQDIESLFQSQNWNFKFTQLIGAYELRVCCHDYNGLVGVSKGLGANKTIYKLSQDLIKRRGNSSGKRAKGKEHKKASFLELKNCNEAVLEVPDLNHVLAKMRIPTGFTKILLTPGKVLGYQASNVVAFEINKQTFMVPASILGVPEEEDIVYQAFRKQQERTKELKVQDQVILDIGLFSLADQQFRDTSGRPACFDSVLAKAVILAFDDFRDEAVLKFRDGSIYAVPTEFVVAPNHYLEDLVQIGKKNTPSDVMRMVPQRYSSGEMDLAILVRRHFEKMIQSKCEISYNRQSDAQLWIYVYIPSGMDRVDLQMVSDSITANESGIKAIQKDDTLEVTQEKTNTTVVARQTMEDESIFETAQVTLAKNEMSHLKVHSSQVLPPLPSVDTDDASSQATADEVERCSGDQINVAEEDGGGEVHRINAQNLTESAISEPLSHGKAIGTHSALKTIPYNEATRELGLEKFLKSSQLGESQPQLNRQSSTYGEVTESQKEAFNSQQQTIYTFKDCTIYTSNFGASGPVEQSVFSPANAEC